MVEEWDAGKAIKAVAGKNQNENDKTGGHLSPFFTCDNKVVNIYLRPIYILPICHGYRPIYKVGHLGKR